MNELVSSLSTSVKIGAYELSMYDDVVKSGYVKMTKKRTTVAGLITMVPKMMVPKTIQCSKRMLQQHTNSIVWIQSEMLCLGWQSLVMEMSMVMVF